MKFMLYYKTTKMLTWNPFMRFEAANVKDVNQYAELCQRTDQLNRIFSAKEIK